MRESILAIVAGALLAACRPQSRPGEVPDPDHRGRGALARAAGRTTYAYHRRDHRRERWSPVPINVNNRSGGSARHGYTYLLGKKGDPTWSPLRRHHRVEQRSRGAMARNHGT